MNHFYNQNTPTITLPFADWQSTFIQNFQQLYTVFSQNHVPLDALANAGNHTIIELPQQDLSQQTNQGEIAVYTKEVPGQTDQIFMRYQGNGQEFQFTTYQLYSLGNFNPGDANQYFTFLPGNIIFIFGYQPQGSKDIILKPPIIRNVISCIITPIGAAGQQFAGVNFTATAQQGIINTLHLEVAPFAISIGGGQGVGTNPGSVSAITYVLLGNI